ncbi:nucleoside recognition domain-containing protein [Rapidithrix thailandica]|uniref:Nucleoside recognition domain-containing protein n=1 Tax=Rapidithrix thailandica TaxID=413964 RepID=A0AAW9S9K8_9BACT
MVLNYIWAGFFLIAFVFALFQLIVTGDHEIFSKLVNSTFEMSKTGFEIALFLTGILSLWMGLLKVGEKAGAIDQLAKLVSPFFTRIFPGIPKNHPAMGSMIMNFSANMLGIDNAATPMGLRAMEQMQSLNPKKDTASNAQIMFLVLNTSGLTLIPFSIMVYRAEMGAANPSDIFIPILLATGISTISGLIIVSIYQKINLLDRVVMLYLGCLVALIAGAIFVFSQMEQSQVEKVSLVLSNVILFSVIVLFIGMAMYRKVNAYEAFIEGAKGGFEIAVKIIPYLVAILVAIGVFRASGAMEALLGFIASGFHYIGWDAEFVKALPTGLMRPLSGSGARGLMLEAMDTYGADSLAGRMVSVMQGATDTTLYVVAVYFGSVNIRKTRYAITCGLFADFVGVIAAVFISYLFFG